MVLKRPQQIAIGAGLTVFRTAGLFRHFQQIVAPATKSLKEIPSADPKGPTFLSVREQPCKRAEFGFRYCAPDAASEIEGTVP